MKNPVMFIVMILLATFSLQASPSVSTDLTYTSKYVFRGVELATGAVQPSVNVQAGSLSFTAWNSTPVEKNYEVEFDYTAAYNIAITKKWGVDLGATVYHYPGLNPGKKHTTEGLVALNGELFGFNMSDKAFYDRDLKTFTIEKTIGRSIELTSKVAVNLNASLGHVRPDSGSTYFYYGAGASVPFKLSEKSSLTLGGQWADHNIDGVPGNHIWGTISVGYKF